MSDSPRFYYVAQFHRDGRVSIENVMEGTVDEVRERIMTSRNYEDGTYLLLEKNAPLVRKGDFA